MWQTQTHKSSFRESLKALEADIQHANSLAAALPWDLSVQMKVSCSPLATFLLFLIEWMDYSCLGLLHILVYKVYVGGMPTMPPQESKATLRDFYAVIYPSLKQMEGGNLTGKWRGNLSRVDVEREEDVDECGICMESSGANMVLPNCGHSMCINCFHDWYVRSESCPFCRGSLKRVESGDLWVLTGNSDVVDTITLAHENLRQFYLYIDKLPPVVSETNNASVYDYLM